MSNKNNKTLLVVKDIQSNIINGLLNPGDKLLPLRDLAVKYDTSRSVINSAIHILSTKGYLKITPRHFVEINDFLHTGSLDVLKDIYFDSNQELKKKTILEVFNMRMIAELDAIKQIIDNKQPISDLESILHEEKMLLESSNHSIDKMIQLDCKYHECLVKSSNNSVLFLLYKSFNDIENDLVKKFYKYTKGLSSIITVHQKLVELIKLKKKKEAISLWSYLLLEGERVVLENLELI